MKLVKSLLLGFRCRPRCRCWRQAADLPSRKAARLTMSAFARLRSATALASLSFPAPKPACASPAAFALNISLASVSTVA